ncbi:hypothetical protein HDV03_002767 [Kappamyces sp. JEL0829]|nr:hypothetical protein HDV03_002767 [Kappamyces sp. JEL0829]
MKPESRHSVAGAETAEGRASLSKPPVSNLTDLRSAAISNPVLNSVAAKAMNPFSSSNLDKTHAMSLPAVNAPPKVMPLNLKNDISQFKIDGFAKKYFTTQRKGLFRRKVPMAKMLVYQKDGIPGPLLNLASSLHKDAVKCFKLLQKILTAKGDMLSCYDDIQNLLEKGIRIGSLRDEIFVQACKVRHTLQVHRGWQVMGVLVATFPPSKNLENYLKNFVQQHFGLEGAGSALDTIIRHAYSVLVRTCKTGPRGRTMTRAELDQVVQAPFKNSVFGDSLERIMERQKQESNDELPKVLTSLIAVFKRLEGQKSEGIFRVPGDAEGVSDLKCRIDKNDYDFSYLTDPNIPSSLLKLWLRELAEPLIPSDFYGACVAIGQKKDNPALEKECLQDANEIIASLPDINRKVARCMIEFLKMVAEPQNQPVTKMSAANVAMVFAPNFLRCPSDDPVVIFENTKFEQAFLKILIAT